MKVFEVAELVATVLDVGVQAFVVMVVEQRGLRFGLVSSQLVVEEATVPYLTCSSLGQVAWACFRGTARLARVGDRGRAYSCFESLRCFALVDRLVRSAIV